MEPLLQMGLSNACLAFVLAIVAMLVGAKANRPHLAHTLWLLVLVRLVAPPIVTVPIGISLAQPVMNTTHDDSPAEKQLPAGHELDVKIDEAARGASRLSNIGAMLNAAKPWLASIWLIGSVCVLAWSVRRVFHFSRFLRASTEPAPHELHTTGAIIAKQLGLNTLPVILTTSAHLSPMVWWTGGRVRVVIPASLLDEMDASEWRWVLAHELAHVRRRDYLVRWLEWLACVCFWWNPVVWWAQRNLRATEEICCDALVLSCLKPKPGSYANSLLTAVEFLVSPDLRPPAMASEINSGGFLERRFRMIVTETPIRANSRWLQACVLFCATVMLPFGVANARDYDAVEKRLGEAVSKGELTLEQAGAMMAALRQAGDDGRHRKDIASSEDWIEDRLQAVGKRLKAAVKAGKLTEAKAWAKWEEIKEKEIAPRLKAAVAKGEMWEEEARGIWNEIRKAENGERLRSAVAKGELSAEEARAKWTEINKQVDEERKEERVAKYRAIQARIRAAVEDGELSPEDAEKKLVATREHMFGDERPDWDAIKGRIERAVESGRITREVADAKYKEIRKRVARKDKRESPDWDAIKQRIEAAVESGRMTREAADAKYKQIIKRIRDGSREEPDWDAIKRRIEAAVESGRMTREEADAKYRELKKQSDQ